MKYTYKKFLLFFILIFTLSYTKQFSCPTEKQKFVIGCWKGGFFATFFAVLNNLAWADKNNKIPVIYWDKSSHYWQEQGYNGNQNVWQYYFEPVSKSKYNFDDKVYLQYFDPSGRGVGYEEIIFKGPSCKSTRNYLNGIIKKYIKIKPPVQNKIDTFYNQYMKNKINIAIHLRGTDKDLEYKNKPNFKLILNEANKLAEQLGECQFFIATDEEKLLEQAKQLLNRQIIFYDCIRSKDGKALHKNLVHENSKALLGEQVLIDALLLSKCDYFIHVRASNVAMAVLCFNPKIKTILFDDKRSFRDF